MHFCGGQNIGSEAGVWVRCYHMLVTLLEVVPVQPKKVQVIILIFDRLKLRSLHINTGNSQCVQLSARSTL